MMIQVPMFHCFGMVARDDSRDDARHDALAAAVLLD